MLSLRNILKKEASRRLARCRLGRVGTLGALSMVVLFAAACDSLLEVELPGQLREEDLNDPRLSEVLVRSVQGDFDCALGRYVHAGGMWGNDLYVATTDSRLRLTQLRSREIEIFDQLACDEGPFPPILLPFQTVRFTAEDYIERINGFDAASVENKDFLIGALNAYAGYAYQILGETMCELTFDGGSIVSREATMALAEQRFTSAIESASRSSFAAARSIVNMALVGRARSKLNRGDGAGAVADASQVDPGFVRYAEMDEGNSRRYNRIFETITSSGSDTIHPSYHNLEVGGVPDPRVPLEHVGLGVGRDGISDMWIQFKYPARGSDIPFSSWREAQLMIAEVELGQTAVGIINNLRATVTDLPFVDADPGLPVFISNDAGEIRAQAWEERRRELFLQGTKVGDILRLDIPGVTTDDFDTGLNQRGQPYGPHTCYPLPDVEKLQNQNI